MKFFNFFSKYIAKESEMALDPVCKMKVLRQTSLKSEIGGITYYFCSESCRSEFIKKSEHSSN